MYDSIGHIENPHYNLETGKNGSQNNYEINSEGEYGEENLDHY